ncbi:MAG: hypothetical protein AAB513_02995 [Patescibacteria group bacterium]
MSRLHGKIQKKIILLLLAGVAFGLTRSPNRQWKIIKELREEWKNINRKYLEQAVNSLYKSNLISHKDNPDGTTTVFLSKKGKEIALTYNLDKISISKPKKWDNKWRMVTFDIPEKFRRTRDALRFHLKRMEFFEYQKSIFVTPYPCIKEIEYLREFYRIKPYVRILLVEKLDNAPHLRKHFNLL